MFRRIEHLDQQMEELAIRDPKIILDPNVEVVEAEPADGRAGKIPEEGVLGSYESTCLGERQVPAQIGSTKIAGAEAVRELPDQTKDRGRGPEIAANAPPSVNWSATRALCTYRRVDSRPQLFSNWRVRRASFVWAPAIGTGSVSHE